MPEPRFFVISLFMAASMLVLAACSKRSQSVACDDTNHIKKVDHQIDLNNQDLALVEPVSVIKSCDQKRFSHNDFTRKIVQISSSINFPIPIGFNLTSTIYNGESDKLHIQGSCFVYDGNLSIGKTVIFYGNNLKEVGWVYDNYSTFSEGLMVCSQKGIKVIVSIRRIKKEFEKITRIIIFFKHNNHQSEQ